jgi:hypothetical protein
LLFSAEGIFADAMAKLREINVQEYIDHLERLFARFGEIWVWFESIEPPMKGDRMPDVGMRMTSVCRCIIFRLLGFISCA